MHRILKFMPVVAIAFTTGGLFLSPALAQDHFIGEQRSAGGVIQLRSNSTPTLVEKKTAQIDTSRSARTTQNTLDAPPIPTGTRYDGIRTNSTVPQILQSTNMPPRVAEEPLVKKRLSESDAKPVVRAPLATPASTPKSDFLSVAKETSQNRVAPTTKPISISKSAPAIYTQIDAPGYINLNQPATLRIKLQNVSDTTANSAKLIATLPAHAKFVRSNPAPSRIDGLIYEFQLSNLASQQNREITIELIPTEKKPLDIGTEVVVENVQRIALSVRQPKIKLSLQGPTEANMGQAVNHKVMLENTGDGLASQIELLAVFPSQLLCTKKSEITIPTLEPGQSVVVEIPSLAASAGQAELKVDVAAIGVAAQQVKAAIRIFQPELNVSVIGPQMNFVNRDGMYTIKLDNTGSVDATNVKIQLTMPSGMQVTTISREANVDTKKSQLEWTFDRIPAKSEQTIMLKTLATEQGEQICNIKVKSKETRDKDIQLATMIATRAELNVVVENQGGPVQVGGRTQFVVIVENKGSSDATDVTLNIELPESVTAEKQDGIDLLGFGNTVRFEAAKIPAGEKREFVLSAIANSKGEQIVRSVLQTASSERKIITEGSVFVYEVNESRVSEALTPALVR